MANFAGDFSSSYALSATLYATSTGVSTNANAQGVSVDLVDNVGAVLSAVQIVGNAAGTTPTMDAKMQESTDGTTWTDVASGTFTQVTASNNVQVIPIKPTKRYVRSTATVAGTNPVFEATVAVLFPRRTSPTSFGGFSNTVAAG